MGLVANIDALVLPFSGTGALPAQLEAYNTPAAASVVSDNLAMQSRVDGDYSGVQSVNGYDWRTSAMTFEIPASHAANTMILHAVAATGNGPAARVNAEFGLNIDAGLFGGGFYGNLAGGNGNRWFRIRDRKSTRLNSSHSTLSRMPSSA